MPNQVTIQGSNQTFSGELILTDYGRDRVLQRVAQDTSFEPFNLTEVVIGNRLNNAYNSSITAMGSEIQSFSISNDNISVVDNVCYIRCELDLEGEVTLQEIGVFETINNSRRLFAYASGFSMVKSANVTYDLIVRLELSMAFNNEHYSNYDVVLDDSEYALAPEIDNMWGAIGRFQLDLERCVEANTIKLGYNKAQAYILEHQNMIDILRNTLVLGRYEKLINRLGNENITDCFYYVDDFVLLFEKCVDETNVKNGILQCINEVFFKQNNLQFQNKVKAHIDDAKYTFITDQSLPKNFTWLGYKFSINKKSQGFSITLDIADSKINYYKKVFFFLVKKNYEDKDKLRLMLYVNTRSIVTKIHKQGKANKNVSLSPFKFYKNFKKYPDLIGEDTKKFMQNVVIHAFNEQSLPLPYYLKDNNANSGYNLWHNFIKNKAIVLNKKFGWSYEKLSKTISRHCDIDIHSKSYEQLAQIFIDNFVIKLQ